MYKYFKAKEKLKKIFNYFSIFTIIFGSLIGTFNSAYATDGETKTFGSGTATSSITQATLADDGANGALSTGDADLVIDEDGSIVLGANLSIDALTSEDDDVADNIALSGGYKLTITEAITTLAGDPLTITLSGTSTSIDIGEAEVEGDATTGPLKIVLGSGTTAITSGADTHIANFDGSSAGVGTLSVTGTSTFSDEIGETFSLGTITVATTKTGTFSEEVYATTINSVGTTVFKKAITATSIILDGTSTVNNTAAIAVAGDYTESAAGDTTKLIIKDSADGAGALATFSGDITLDDIEVGEADEKAGIAKFTGTITADVLITGGDATELSQAEFSGNLTGAITLAEANSGTATFKTSGSTANTITGAITTTNSKGALVVSNTGGTTFTAGIGTDAAKLKSATVSASSEAIFAGAVAADTLTITGTATLQAAANESEVFAMGASSILYIDKTVTNGQVVISEVATTRPTLTSGAKIYMPENLSDGQTLVLFDEEADNSLADHATTITETNAAIQDNALINYVAASSSDSLVVTANAKTAGATATELSVTTNDAKALKQALASAISDTTVDGTAEDAFNNALNGIGGLSSTDDTALAKQVGPQTDMISGSSVAAQAVTGSIQGIMSSRMASLRSGDAYFGTGIAAGGMSAQSGFIQVFGSTAEQNNKTVGSGTQYGYESNTEGLAIGFDGVTDGGMTIGVSLATANTDVDGKGTGKSTNSIDTYSASLYMDRATDAGYVEGSVTFGLNENTTSRKVNTAGLDRTYKGSYDSQSLSVNISAGAPNEVGNGYLTPFGSFTASFMDIDAYTESSTVANDALRLKVAQDDVNSMIGTLGIKYHAEMGNGGTPMISLAINNEFGDDTIDSTNTYQNGGIAFKTTTAVEELSATLGLGYSYGSDATSIELAYEADVNDDEYLSHYGSIKIVGKF